MVSFVSSNQHDALSVTWVKTISSKNVWLLNRLEVRLFELRILDTIARHCSIQERPSSKERVGSRKDVTSTNQDTNFSCFDVLIGWRHMLPRPTLSFELGHFLIEKWWAIVSRIRSSISRTSRQSHGLKFGMVGAYNTYFRNIKREDMVTFWP